MAVNMTAGIQKSFFWETSTGTWCLLVWCCFALLNIIAVVGPAAHLWTVGEDPLFWSRGTKFIFEVSKGILGEKAKMISFGLPVVFFGIFWYGFLGAIIAGTIYATAKVRWRIERGRWH